MSSSSFIVSMFPLISLLALPSTTLTNALQNGVAKLPAMGYNTWNRYACNISEQLVLDTANSMISLGLKDVGYSYVNLDDCWLTMNRSDDGKLVPDPEKFPNGISGLVDQLHSLGFKAGIYEDAGSQTCAGYPGSLGHETTDAQSFADWGIDYLKYDNCNVPSNYTDDQTEMRYDAMRDALNATGRDILFSMCSWGTDSVWTYGNKTGNSWRMTGDITSTWDSAASILQQVAPYTNYTNFWGHGDEDMLELGNGNLTIDEQRTHFTAWALLKSPLLIGTDLSSVSNDTLEILLNQDVIAISQDSVVGDSVAPFNYDASQIPPSSWSGPSENGTVIMLINTNNDTASDLSFKFTDVPLFSSDSSNATSYKFYDLWQHSSSDCISTTDNDGTYTVKSVPVHGVYAAVASSC